MRYLIQSVAVLTFCLLLSVAEAQNKVVVVPMGGAMGDAVPADVVEGKTFSSKSGKGLIGTRSPGVLGKTGQTLCYDPACTTEPSCAQVTCAGTGQDGELQKGVAVSPRFTDNGYGTVTDILTGLIWLRDGYCSTFFAGDLSLQNARPWQQALEAAQRLGAGYCGLTDGSVAGDWRLPNIRELQSLIDFSQTDPALPPDHPFFITTLAMHYWSSTTYSRNTYAAWRLDFYGGQIIDSRKSSSYYVLAIRGGQ